MDELETFILHGVYVSNLAYLLSKEVGLPEEQSYELAVAGLLHDIGKVKISGKMIEQEGHDFLVRQMNYLRQHPFLGFEVLKAFGYSEFILESVLFHHENYDGSGYPSSLSGDLIPIGARILRICDVFIALVSDRAYRAAYDVNSAVEIMIDHVNQVYTPGSVFDSHLSRPIVTYKALATYLRRDEQPHMSLSGLAPGGVYMAF